MFRDAYKLSARKGKFLVFEHVDEHPLFVTNFGMASKLFRYVYSEAPVPLRHFRQQSTQMGKLEHMGFYGAQVLLREG